MTRIGLDLYNIGNSPEELQSALVRLRQEFDAHNHDGASSRDFQTLIAETISARTILIRKTSYTDDTGGLWAGLVDNDPRLYLGDASAFIKYEGGVLTFTGAVVTGYIQVGGALSDVGSGNITETYIANGAITAGKISVSTLSAITANIGAITAGTIDGVTITGGTIQTSATGLRLVMSGTNDAYEFRSSSTLLAHLKSATVPYSGLSGAILEHGTGEIGLEVSGQGVGLGSRQIVMADGAGASYFGFLDNDAGAYYLFGNVDYQGHWIPQADNTYDLGSGSKEWRNLYIDGTANIDTLTLATTAGLGVGSDLNPTLTGTYDLGSTSREWQDLHLNNDFNYRSIAQPVVYHGYCSGTTISKDNNSFTLSNPSTGLYTVTHNLGTTNYVVAITPFAATVKNCTVDSLGTNSFSVRMANLSDSLEDNDFMFILTLLA